ncbi:uncharacterized protein [Chironomus tepperi]|uniref:uncharacterized protein n=1 Tax=Chironomus tepperi TaxID=113505 RepID=UPI00391FB9EC
MGLYPFILLLIALTANITNGYKIVPLNETQALLFEEIGELKLIKSYRALNYEINIGNLTKSIQDANEFFFTVKDKFENDSSTQNKLSNIKMVLDLKKMEFEDTLYGLVKTETHSIQKRDILNFLTIEDKKEIYMDLGRHRDKTNEVVEISNSLRSIAHNSSTLLNNTIEEITRKSTMMILTDQRDEIERFVNALTKMLTERRLNSEIIPITELDKSIKNITLNSDETLPYKRLIDYYYNLRLNYTIDEDSIKFEVYIPIVEKLPRKLFKIVEIPARHDGKLIMTDVIWKYIAENDNETAVFMTLDVCYKSQSNGIVYYCKTQSPIKSKDADDCLNKALSTSSNNTIDMNLCKYSAVQPTSLMFIKLNDGEYFYYTPNNETLTVMCGAGSTDEILVEQTSGIIKLDPECIAVTSTYKLITTMRYGPTNNNKINIVRVSFNVDELKENIKKYNAPYVDKFYIESMALLRDMSKPIKSVATLDQGIFSSGFVGNWTIIASLIIVTFVLYRARKWKSNKQKKSQNITEKFAEEPVDFYVIK